MDLIKFNTAKVEINKYFVNFINAKCENQLEFFLFYLNQTKEDRFYILNIMKQYLEIKKKDKLADDLGKIIIQFEKL